MTSRDRQQLNASRDQLAEIVLFVLRHDETDQPSLDRLQSLLFLVDREHSRSFGVVLTFLPWKRERIGPRSDDLFPVLKKLDDAAQLPKSFIMGSKTQRSIAEPKLQYEPDQRANFSPRAARSLQRVLWQYGSATDDRIREEFESTDAYQLTPAGEQIDLSGERAWLWEKVAQEGIDDRSRGDPEESAREDEEIMEFFDQWRIQARRQQRGH